MAIHLNLKDLAGNVSQENAKLHWLPCVVKSDGDAKVSEYFESLFENHTGDSLKSSFRGYPLLGKEITVPKNYCGIIMRETRLKLNEEAERNIYKTHAFDKFIYWNRDVEPSGNDRIILAMEWLDVAEALHSSDDE